MSDLAARIIAGSAAAIAVGSMVATLGAIAQAGALKERLTALNSEQAATAEIIRTIVGNDEKQTEALYRIAVMITKPGALNVTKLEPTP